MISITHLQLVPVAASPLCKVLLRASGGRSVGALKYFSDSRDQSYLVDSNDAINSFSTEQTFR